MTTLHPELIKAILIIKRISNMSGAALCPQEEEEGVRSIPTCNMCPFWITGTEWQSLGGYCCLLKVVRIAEDIGVLTPKKTRKRREPGGRILDL